MKLNGAAIVTAILARRGVDTIFGYPGGNVLPLYAALSSSTRLKHVLTASEAGAAHAADGYARASGRVGVCIATSGPGATNLVTGIATAYMDSSPVVFITGNVAVAQIGSDSFQEVDITGITQPITKHNVMVKKVENLATALNFAFDVAMEGRRGPVLVDIPLDVQTAECEYTTFDSLPVAKAKHYSQRDLDMATDMINRAANPVILAGGGTVDAAPQLLRFAERLRCKVAVTMMALGIFPSNHPHFCGMAGVHGTPQAADALTNADLIVAVGTRFSDRLADMSRERERAVLHIDIDRSEINKNIKSRFFVQGDAGEILSELTSKIKQNSTPDALHLHPDRGTDGVCSVTSDCSTEVCNPRYLLSKLRDFFGDALIATDVGKHQVWTAQTVPFFQPRTLLTSGGMGTMGFGLGAAIGGALAAKKRAVLVTGDGSFAMNQNEIMTAVRERLPIVVVVLRNESLDMVCEQQREMGYNYMVELSALPNFVKLAESYGAQGLRVESNDQIEDVFARAAGCETPVVIDCKIAAGVSGGMSGRAIKWENEEDEVQP